MDRSTKRTAAGDEIREASDARPGRDDSPRRDPGVTGPASPTPDRPETGGSRAVPSRTDRPETASNPAPGIRHEPEPDAGNIMPAEDEPGTL
jgi:hypothetical protein